VAGEAPYVPNITSARQFVERFYGGVIQTHPKDSDYTVTTTAQALGANTGQRLSWIISNTGSNNVAWSYSQTVTITTGIILQPGGWAAVNVYYDWDLIFKVPYIIAATGGSTVHMIENILVGY
jgi:hypothetical protein